jgi:hypothetical protein
MNYINDCKKYECCICLEICIDSVTLSCCSQNYCDKCIRKSFLIKEECCVCRAKKSVKDIKRNEYLIDIIKKKFPKYDNEENNNVENNIENNNIIDSNLIVKYSDDDLIGKIVKKGPDWNNDDLPFSSNCFGKIIKKGDNKKYVYVKWFNNYMNAYSIGHNNKYSLTYA